MNSVGKMFVRLDLMFFVVIVRSNGCFGNGHSNNEINRSEIELMKAEMSKLRKELDETKEKVQILTENCQISKTEVIDTHGKCFDQVLVY